MILTARNTIARLLESSLTPRLVLFCFSLFYFVGFFFQEMKRLERARKKAEAICDTVDVSEKEKMNQIKR